MELSNEEFKLLVGILRYACRIFYLSQYGQSEIGKDPCTKPYNDFKNMWAHILISWRNYYLINFAKLFDAPFYQKGKEKMYNLSIFRAIPREKFDSTNSDTIRNLITARKKIGAHADAEAISQGKRREKDYDLGVYGEKIDSLIRNTFELINQSGEKFGYSHKLNADKEKILIQKEFDEWYEIFKQKYNC